MPETRSRSTPPSKGSEVTLVFDGGSLGNPGKGYGSYVIMGPGDDRQHRRVEYPGTTTNNEAEYLTLIEGLTDILDHLRRAGGSPADVSLRVLSDSKLVVEQLAGNWKVRKAELRPLHQQAAELLRSFGRASVSWHARANSVRILGH